jgi:MtN3 and saliva related transmembrane protein
MSEERTTTIIGFIGCILIIISALPQLYKIIKTKSAKDVSIITYIILFIAQSLWTSYGVLKNDLQITITNGISVVITLAIVISALIYN